MKNIEGMSYNKTYDETTIILCAGAMPYSELPIITNQSNAMIPVSGKPVIGWILDDLLTKKKNQVTIVLQEHDYHLKKFIQRSYDKRMNISIASLRQSMTILESLLKGILHNPAKEFVRIILGDTLIRDTFDSKKDFVYTGIVEDSRRWCLVSTDTDNKIVDYIDKQKTNIQPKIALAGYYHLMHGVFLQKCLKKAIDEGKKQISDVLKYYSIKYPIEIRNANEWYDFGHIEKLMDARNRLLQHRYFNSLHIDPVLSTITKISEKNEKLEDELNWYFQIPDALKILTPRIVKYSNSDNKVKIVSEYYGYPTMAELYVYGDLQIDYWIMIIKSILGIHKQFQQYSGELEAHFVEKMYLTKTLDRFYELSHQDKYWGNLLALETINFNGSILRNFNALKDPFICKVKTIIESSRICAIHGDLCFSNILFDINNWIIRLIDPRGSFGQRGIYGDPRYDIAKLRHSISGFYDFIMADMFYIEKTTDGFTGYIYSNDNCNKIADEFDKMLCEQKYNIDEIIFIEGILFISMAALHKDHPDRQLLMYLTGLKLLNEVLK
jgi:dTDP-glucose pyrophosphorylase